MFDFPAVVENMLPFHVPGLVCILDLKNSDILSNDRMSNLFPPECFLSCKHYWVLVALVNCEPALCREEREKSRTCWPIGPCWHHLQQDFQHLMSDFSHLESLNMYVCFLPVRFLYTHGHHASLCGRCISSRTHAAITWPSCTIPQEIHKERSSFKSAVPFENKMWKRTQCVNAASNQHSSMQMLLGCAINNI